MLTYLSVAFGLCPCCSPAPCSPHRHHFSLCSFSVTCAGDSAGSFSQMLCSFPSGPVLWWSFPPQKAFHWVTATSNFTTACVQGRQASESGVWCHLLDIWHFLSKPVWPFPLSWLPVGFLMGFVCPSSLRVFLLNGAPESTPIGMQLYSLFWWGSRSGGTTDAVPLDYSCPSFRHNAAMLHVVQLFSPPFEIHLQLWTLPFPQCWLLKPLKTKIYFLLIHSKFFRP